LEEKPYKLPGIDNEEDPFGIDIVEAYPEYESSESSNTATEKSVQKADDKDANTEKDDSSNKRDDSKDGDPSSSKK